MECMMRVVKRTLKHCHFQIMGIPEWEVKGKRTWHFDRAEFGVYRNEKLQYVLKQPNPITRILSNLPLVWAFYESPFYFYRDGVKCGTWKPIQHPAFLPGRWKFCFEDKTYQLELGPYYGLKNLLHNDLWMPQDTLFVNGKKAAVYTRQAELEPSIIHIKYSIEYTEELAGRPDILLLFGAFIENYLSRDKDNGGIYHYYTNQKKVQ